MRYRANLAHIFPATLGLAAFVLATVGCNAKDENQTASNGGKKPAVNEPAAKAPTESPKLPITAADPKPPNAPGAKEAPKPEDRSPEKKPDVPMPSPEAAKPETKEPTTPATPTAPNGDRPAEPAKAAPSADAPSATPPKPAEAAGEKTPRADPSFAARKDLDIEGQMRLILDMVNQPRAVRKAPDFVDHFVSVADALLASEASEGNKSTALLAKFKVLHEASVDGNAAAQQKLVKLADEQRENKGKRAAAFVRFVNLEQKLIAAQSAAAEKIPESLEALLAYLAAEEELTNRQLRMSLVATSLIEKLPEAGQEAWFKKLGAEFSKSVDIDLAHIGKRYGKPPVPPSAILGKEFTLAGKLFSGEDLKWQNYKGKITVVEFWATWCPLCIEQHAHLKKLRDDYGARGLELVGVSIDSSREDLDRYLRENEIMWITLFGKEPQEVAAKYGVRGIPALFLIDVDGKVLMKTNTVAEIEPAVKSHIEALEKKKKAAEKK